LEQKDFMEAEQKQARWAKIENQLSSD